MKQKLFILLGILIGLISCQKQVDTFPENEIPHVTSKLNYNRFFPESETDNLAIKRIFEYLKSENSKTDFLSDFVKVAGYPRWDKTLLKKAAEMQNIVFANPAYRESDIICVIPLVSERNTA